MLKKFWDSLEGWAKVIILLLIALVIVLLAFNIASAKDLTLEWNASNRADGYKLYWKVKGDTSDYNTTNVIDVGNVTTFDVLNFPDDTLFCFVCTAYNETAESKYSNEACELNIPGSLIIK